MDSVYWRSPPDGEKPKIELSGHSFLSSINREVCPESRRGVS
jgi:hypothetical protein